MGWCLGYTCQRELKDIPNVVWVPDRYVYGSGDVWKDLPDREKLQAALKQAILDADGDPEHYWNRENHIGYGRCLDILVFWTRPINKDPAKGWMRELNGVVP